MATSRLDAWRRITLDPCNRTVERRNVAATRDAFEQFYNYVTNVTNVTNTGASVVFFKITTTDVGAATTDAVLLKTPGFTDDGDAVTVYDYTPNLRLSYNFIDGRYGCGVLAPEIAEDAVIAIEIEGKARFIDGTFNEHMPSDGSRLVEVTVDNYWGAQPNIHDPGTDFDVFDRDNIAPNAKSGERYVACWDEVAQKYIIISYDSREIIPFEITGTTDIGAASIEVKEYDWVAETYTGRVWTAYDITPNSRYAQNFEQGFRGFARHAPEIADDAIVVFELEGRARFIDGVLSTGVTSGTATGTVENWWGAYPNIKPPTAPVTLYDREGYATGVAADNRYLAVWDEQDQKYILILPIGCQCSQNSMEFVEFCGDTETLANSCCLYPGQRFHIDPSTPGFCIPEHCIVPVWLWCMQGTQEDDPWPLGANWCDFGKLLKTNHNCNGDIRDVYGIDCGDCVTCHCPGLTMKATLQAFDCVAATTITLTAVSQNPITAGGVPGWWGEFELTGSYPVMIVQVATDPFTFMGHERTEVYIAIGCNATDYSSLADWCTAGTVYVWLDAVGEDGSFVAYTGSYTSVSVGAAMSLVDSEGCQVFCTRTFKYGLFVQCDDGALFGGALYHLYPEESITRIVDPLAGLSVPSSGQSIGDTESLEMYTTSGCCEMSQNARCDPQFGDAYTCNVAMPNESGGAVFSSVNVMGYHVLGGCTDTIATYHGSLPICGDTVGSTLVYFVFDWSGTDTCKYGLGG